MYHVTNTHDAALSIKTKYQTVEAVMNFDLSGLLTSGEQLLDLIDVLHFPSSYIIQMIQRR